jgi:hypothetical protein
VRVYGNSLIIRAKAEEIRASMAKIPGIEDPRVELQVEEPSIGQGGYRSRGRLSA